jgi:hypothetical protein
VFPNTANVALITVGPVSVNEQGEVLPTQVPEFDPESAQPEKEDPVVGVAVKVTVMFNLPVEEQAEPQFIEPAEVTVPDPAPDLRILTG